LSFIQKRRNDPTTVPKSAESTEGDLFRRYASFNLFDQLPNYPPSLKGAVANSRCCTRKHCTSDIRQPKATIFINSINNDSNNVKRA
jgi:hypothetical protein